MLIADNLTRAAYRTKQLSLLVNAIVLEKAARQLIGVKAAPLPKRTILRVQKRVFDLIERDWDNAAAGLYPRSLLFRLPLRRFAKAAPLLLRDIPRLLQRAREGNYHDLPADLDRSQYPAYYTRTFHWQTDGYFSERSAATYDLGVELLFRGTADTMRRQIIPPITRYLANRPSASTKLLDVACGTGLPLDQLAIAHPQVAYTGIDMSPFYVNAARKRLQHVDHLQLDTGNAEYMDYPDCHFDIVTSVYLFHELPRNARRRVFAQMLRVLKPGGLLVIEDSAQIAEAHDIEPALRAFPKNFHEPFYNDYLEDDLALALSEAGFATPTVESHAVSKVVIATKPSD